jgi:hypothetical protein
MNDWLLLPRMKQPQQQRQHQGRRGRRLRVEAGEEVVEEQQLGGKGVGQRRLVQQQETEMQKGQGRHHQ